MQLNSQLVLPSNYAYIMVLLYIPCVNLFHSFNLFVCLFEHWFKHLCIVFIILMVLNDFFSFSLFILLLWFWHEIWPEHIQRVFHPGSSGVGGDLCPWTEGDTWAREPVIHGVGTALPGNWIARGCFAVCLWRWTGCHLFTVSQSVQRSKLV